MTPDEARELARSGETLTVEFKRGKKRDLKDGTIVDAVTCLANGSGGTLLLGVEDDGTITGLEPRHGETTKPHLLQAMILNHTDPPVEAAVELIRVDDVEVGIVDVPRAESPVGTTGGKYIKRHIDAVGRPECVPYPLHEMLSVGLAAHGTDYATVRARGATWSDIDGAEIERFRSLCETDRGDSVLSAATDSAILRALRLLRSGSDEFTLGAILLFGTPVAVERFVPTAEVLFTELQGGKITSSESLRLPLMRTAQRLYDLLSARNTEQEVMIGIHRVGVKRVPEAVIRETIANALVHRDYTELGHISVQLDDDEFRVESPGGFPRGTTLENLLDTSNPRSPALAEAFKRAGIVDRAGRGIQEIYSQLLRAGRGEPDYAASSDTSVVVKVPTSDADVETVRFILDYEDRAGQQLNLLQLRIIHELKAVGPQSAGELAAGLDASDAKVRTQLTRLIEKGLVETRGTGRNHRHHLTAAFYRSAQSSEYVRLQDTDPIQQQQMILTYVEKYGSITRRKAAQLCRLQPEQARNVLRRLVQTNQLELRGERRTSRYVLPAARNS